MIHAHYFTLYSWMQIFLVLLTICARFCSKSTRLSVPALGHTGGWRMPVFEQRREGRSNAFVTVVIARVTSQPPADISRATHNTSRSFLISLRVRVLGKRTLNWDFLEINYKIWTLRVLSLKPTFEDVIFYEIIKWFQINNNLLNKLHCSSIVDI